MLNSGKAEAPFRSPLALVRYFYQSAIILVVRWAADRGTADQYRGLPTSENSRG
jgi:hypothetical protein